MSITNGVFTRDNGNDRCQQESSNPPHLVDSANMDAEFNDFAGAINQTFFRDGSAVATGNWNMGGFNVSNIGTFQGNVGFSDNVTFNSGSSVNVLGAINFSSLVGDDCVFSGGGKVDLSKITEFNNTARLNSRLIVYGVEGGYLQFNDTPLHSGKCGFDSEIEFKDGIVLKNYTPLSSLEAGTPWKITTDADFLYLWVSANRVKRIPWTSF